MVKSTINFTVKALFFVSFKMYKESLNITGHDVHTSMHLLIWLYLKYILYL